MNFTYRKDGWPLCPICGEDELMSLVTPATTAADGSITIRQPTAADPMRCLACRWFGVVPLIELTARSR